MSKADIDRVLNVFEQVYFAPFKDFNHYYWVSGGAVVDTFIDQPINDVDMHFSSKQIQEEALAHMIEQGFELVKTEPTHFKMFNGLIKYDLLHTWVSPAETIAKYDYEHSCGAIDKNLNFICHDNFFDRLEDKKLIPTNPDNFNEIQQWPVSVIRRLLKCIRKGYTIDTGNLEIVCQQVIDLQDSGRRIK